MIVYCGNCNARYQLPDSRKGVRFRCKVCQSAVYTDDKRRIGPEEKQAMADLERKTVTPAPQRPETNKRRNRLREIREEAMGDTLAILRKEHEEEERLLFGDAAASPTSQLDRALVEEEPGFRDEDLFGEEQETAEAVVSEELAPSIPSTTPPASELHEGTPVMPEVSKTPVDAFLEEERDEDASVSRAAETTQEAVEDDAGAYLELDDAPAENAWLEMEPGAVPEDVPVDEAPAPSLALDELDLESTGQIGDGFAPSAEDDLESVDVEDVPFEEDEDASRTGHEPEEMGEGALSEVTPPFELDAEDESLPFAPETPAAPAQPPEEIPAPSDVEEQDVDRGDDLALLEETDEALPEETDEPEGMDDVALDFGDKDVPAGSEEDAEFGEVEATDIPSEEVGGLTFLSDAAVEGREIPVAPALSSARVEEEGPDGFPDAPMGDMEKPAASPDAEDILDLAPFRLEGREAATRTLVPVAALPTPIHDASALTWMEDGEVGAEPLLAAITVRKHEDGTCTPDRSVRGYCKGCQSRYRLPSSYKHRTQLLCGICGGAVALLLPGMQDPGAAAANLLDAHMPADLEEAEPPLDDATPAGELDHLDADDDYDVDGVEDVDDEMDAPLEDATPVEELDDLDDDGAFDDDLDDDAQEIDDVDDLDDDASEDDDLEELDDLEDDDDEEIDLDDIPDEDLDIEVFDDEKE